jgi:hypothetical protein
MPDNYCERRPFGMPQHHYVIRDCTQLSGSDCLPLSTVLRQVTLHGVITTLLLAAAALALSW